MSFQYTREKKQLWLDWRLFLPIFIISILGMLTLLSSAILPKGGFGDLEIVYKQVLFILSGIPLYFLMSKLDISYLKHWQITITLYIFTILLLLITYLFAPTINNVKRWLVIGGIQLQPSEIAKVTILIVTAVVLSFKHKINEWLLFLISFILILPIIFLIYIEPDAGMALLSLLIWFFVAFLGLSNPFRNTVILLIFLFLTGAFFLPIVLSSTFWYLLIIPAAILSIFAFYSKMKLKLVLIIAIVAGIVVGITTSYIWDKGLHDYQRKRIEAFFSPSTTAQDVIFNVNQSRIAIGSGRILGKGFGNGTQSKRKFLPESQTDFIFASFAEEFGLIGSLSLMSLYGYLIVVIFLVAINSIENEMYSLLAVGIGVKLLLEVFINIGTNIGVMPATGIPLPLMSAGGSAIIMTFISLGIVSNIMNITELGRGDGRREIVNFFEE